MSRAARLGAFIVATLAILVGGIFIIGSKQYLFSSTYQLKAEFNNVAGLAAGGDVRVGGVHSGTVRSIELPHKPGDKVTIVMDLGKSTHEIVKQDSVATIETEGLLGNQYMAISFGSAGSPDVKDGGTISSQPPLEMADLFRKTSRILDSSQQAIQSAANATENLNSISGKINDGKGSAGALVNDKQLYTNLEQTSKAMRDTVIQAQVGVTGFSENMEALKHNILLRGFFKDRGYEDSAELTKNAIDHLPPGERIKEFSYAAKQIFDKHDSAKLKNKKSLNTSGEFLSANKFGIAVVVASVGMEGGTQKNLVLTEARAMVVRDYLVENFGFDDSQLKTLGIGEQTDATSDGGWGTVQIFVYPVGTEAPPKGVQLGNSSVTPVHSSTTAPTKR